MYKKIISFLLCLAFAFFLTSCSDDENLVVAKVNGESIYYSEYQKSLSDYLYNNYGMVESRMDDSFGEENSNKIREMIVDELISQKLLKKQAKELGLTKFTSEQKSTIEKNREDFLADLKEQCESEVQKSNEKKDITMSEEEFDEAVLEKYNKYVENKGYTQEYLYNYYWDELTLSVLREYVFDGLTVTDTEVEDYYNEELANQQSIAQESNITALDNYFSNAYDINLYIPEGINRVKHVYIALPDDILSQTTTSSTDETKALLAEELAKIKPEAQEVLNLLKQGKDFDEVIDEYGDDEDMLDEDVKENGYEISLVSSDKPTELQIAANKLKNPGDISELIETKYGYYILKLVRKTSAGPVDFKTVKDDIKTLIENSKKAELWDNNLEELKSKAEIEKFTDNYIPPTTEELMQ